MTEDDTLIEVLTGESSRRTFMKSGALASGGLALGLSGAGTVGAQDGNGGNAKRGLMFQTNFYPQARFEVKSKPLPWAPVHSQDEGFLNEENQDLLFQNPGVFQNMNARVIEWQFPGQEWGFLFVPNKVSVQQGQIYETSPAFGVFGPEDFQEFGVPEGVEDPGFGAADENAGLDEGFNQLGLITIQFSQVEGGGGQGTTTEGGGDGGGQETTTEGGGS